MKPLNLIILLLTVVFSSTIGHSNNSITYQLHFFHDKKGNTAPEKIPYEDFKPVKKLPFNNGLDNGIYWIKISINNKSKLDQKSIFEIREPYIKRSALYALQDKRIKLLNISGNDFDFNKKEIKTRNIAYPVNIHTGRSEYLVKVSYHRNVNFTFYIYPEKEFYLNEIKFFSTMGVYYGISLFIVLVNICCFFFFKDSIYLFYALTVFLIDLILFHLDGLLIFFLKPGWVYDNIDFFCYMLIPFVGGYCFARRYLNIDYYYPWLKRIEIPLTILSTIFPVIYLLTENIYVFELTIVFILIYLGYYWIISIFLIKKNEYAWVMTLGYVLFFILATSFAIPVTFGYNLLKEEVYVLKIGGVFEMLIFLFSLLLRAKALQKENLRMYKKIQEFICKLKDAQNKNVLLCEESKISIEVYASIKEQFDLTPREIEILECILNKQTNPQIADNLNISINTVKFHIRNIYQKLEVNGREEVFETIIVTNRKDIATV